VKEIFVLPDDRRTRTGGNLYNRHLAAALREEGLDPEVMTIGTALRHAGGQRPARYWVDTLLLDRVAQLRAAAAASSQCFVIVHCVPSLHPAIRGRTLAAWRRAEDTAFAAADGFLVTSRFSALQLARRAVGRKPVMTVLPAPAVRPRRPHARDASRLRALVVANLTPGKGIVELLRALAVDLPRDADFSLEIAGRLDADPAHVAGCTALVERSPALRRRVRFLGALAPAALTRAYERNTFFVSSSHMESFGMALQEARCFGLYLLTIPGGNAASHVKPPSCGEVLPTIEALSRRVARLAADGALRERLLRRMPAPPPTPTWRDAALRFLAQLPGRTA
jgi:glycosyltransferase involved in cell wall biosynthesis